MLKKVGSISKSMFGMLNPDREYHLKINKTSGSLIIFEEVPDEIDITSQCKVDLRMRELGDGYYIKITYKGMNVAVVDVLGQKMPKMYQGYRMERPIGAKYSCRIFKTT